MAESKTDAAADTEAPPLDDLAFALRAVAGDGSGVAIVDGSVVESGAGTPGAGGDLVVAGLKQIVRVTFNQHLHKLEARERGGLDAIMAAMVSHSDNADVQQHGLAALRTLLVGCDPIREGCKENGLLAAIRKALEVSTSFPDGAAAAEAVKSVCALCINHEANSAAAREAEVAPAVQAVMDAFPDNKAVQQKGAFALALVS